MRLDTSPEKMARGREKRERERERERKRAIEIELERVESLYADPRNAFAYRPTDTRESHKMPHWKTVPASSRSYVKIQNTACMPGDFLLTSDVAWASCRVQMICLLLIILSYESANCK
jgi:hypothetical protein